MIVSWNWLSQYVDLPATVEELTERLAMAGLNHESTQAVGDDVAIDLEVTSNRPDWMSHLGVAREISVLYDTPLRVPQADLPDHGEPIGGRTKVRVECPTLCTQYSARLIRGVTVGPSPAWLVNRLATLGLKTINNIVDITNYVLFECGQPLHAFDFAKLRGQRIVVREARPGETIVAIDHRTYPLEPGMCVIADAERPVAIGGVMGGWETEVSASTRDVLIEAAEFNPLSIRVTSRALRLRSPSSERFERGVDPAAVDWASRRCCQLILELAGGTLCAGAIHVQQERSEPQPITLRLDQLPRVLGITVPRQEVRRILVGLGCRELDSSSQDSTLQVIPPTWRRDLTREIDLVEEVARIHGYDKIPEDARVPMVPASRSEEERVLAAVRRVLTAAGFDEAMTVSAVPQEWSESLSPWTKEPALSCQTPVIKGTDQLRRSLLPSLLGARAYNESVGNETVELFETARIYLPCGEQLPEEPLVVGLTSGRDVYTVKGVLEGLLDVLHIGEPLEVDDFAHPFFRKGEAFRLSWKNAPWAILGVTSPATNKLFGLRKPSVVAEFHLAPLMPRCKLVPQYVPLVPYPAIEQDLNFVVDEALRWAQLEEAIRQAGGPELEAVTYRETYRDQRADGLGKKRILLRITLRSRQGTLTTEQANALRDRIVQWAGQRCGARLLGT